MNVTPAIQEYFPATSASDCPLYTPQRHSAGSAYCQIWPVTTQREVSRQPKALDVTFANMFLSISWESHEKVKYKLVKSPYLLSVSWTAVEMYEP